MSGTFSHQVQSLPGETWITVERGSAVPAKYCSLTTLSYPYGFNGPAEARVKFNLTAYVQDMIGEALARSPSPPREGGR